MINVKSTEATEGGWIVYVLADDATGLTNAALSDVIGMAVTVRQRQDMVDGYRVWVSAQPEISGDIPPDPNMALLPEPEATPAEPAAP